MSTADQNTMETLHLKLAKRYMEALDDVDASPALLASAAKFLKDNNVVLIPESTDALTEVAEKYESLNIIDDEPTGHLEFPKKQA